MNQTIYEPESGRAAERDERLMAGLGYVLILVGNIVGVTSLLAAIIAYARKDAAPGWLYSHYVFQIRTFWAALIGIIVCSLMIATVILSPFGLLGFALIWLWVLIRSVIGLIRLVDGRGNADPQGYWV
jgi:uncharacterized membrane protein